MENKRRVRLKYCGVTRVEDAILAAHVGVDALGLNFFPPSPRFVTLDVARSIVARTPFGVEFVGVFVNESVEIIRDHARQIGLNTIQLHGDEPPEFVAALAPLRVIKAFRWQGAQTAQAIVDYNRAAEGKGAGLCAVLVDTYRKGQVGGTGEAWNWREAAQLQTPVPLILAGGLTPENVRLAIEVVAPYAVDVAGGIESVPGCKDPDKMRHFAEEANSLLLTRT